MCVFYVLYNGFYVSDSIALCWATFNAFYALLSSHVMTNKDDDDDDDYILPSFLSQPRAGSSVVRTGPVLFPGWRS